MPRVPKIVLNPNGDGFARVRIPAMFLTFAKEYAAETGDDPLRVFETVINEISLFMASGEKLPFFTKAHQLTLNRLRNVKEFEQLNADDGINDASLHTSTKTSSGYVGVYVNGNGYRAMAADAKGQQITLGTFPTSREAAWCRYLHHKRLGLPYGALADAIEKRLVHYPNAPLGKVKHMAIWDSADAGRPIPGLSIEDRHLEHVDPFDGSAEYDGPNVIVKPRRPPRVPAPKPVPAPAPIPTPAPIVALPAGITALPPEITAEIATELVEKGVEALKTFVAQLKNPTEEVIAAATKLARAKVVPFPKPRDPTEAEIAAHLAKRTPLDKLPK